MFCRNEASMVSPFFFIHGHPITGRHIYPGGFGSHGNILGFLSAFQKSTCQKPVFFLTVRHPAILWALQWRWTKVIGIHKLPMKIYLYKIMPHTHRQFQASGPQDGAQELLGSWVQTTGLARTTVWQTPEGCLLWRGNRKIKNSFLQTLYYYFYVHNCLKAF